MSGSNVSDLIGRSPGGRKLIAVVYADVVGYSRLIGLDDLGTLERLRALRTGLIDPAIDEYGGKIVQTGGDELLIVFDSIDGAVQCAVKVQRQAPDYDGDQPPESDHPLSRRCQRRRRDRRGHRLSWRRCERRGETAGRMSTGWHLRHSSRARSRP